ncbi:hypothetical protein ACWCQL_24325 [Streptomyces sp. NPDC002073]
MTERERPAARPRPAPEATDPAVPRAEDVGGPPSPVSAPRRRRGPAATVQLNTRVDPDVDELVAYVGDMRGWSKRETVEHALRKAYAAEIKELKATKEASERLS